MSFLKRYYNMFKIMNPKNTELKLGVIIALTVFLLFRGIMNFEFSWDIVISLGIFIISMTCHEVAHGYVAYRFGDDTAKRQGRITLNPLKHLDMTGLLLPLLLLLTGSKFLIGWAKPVPVNFSRLRPHRLGLFSVAIAGIVVNLTIAALAGIFLKSMGNSEVLRNLGNAGNVITDIVFYAYVINLALAFFNLIPVTPLDGGRIVHSLSGKIVRQFYEKIEPYGILIVFIIVYSGMFSDVFNQILTFFINLIGINVNIILN